MVTQMEVNLHWSWNVTFTSHFCITKVYRKVQTCRRFIIDDTTLLYKNIQALLMNLSLLKTNLH